jgi:hypothetical protein
LSIRVVLEFTCAHRNRDTGATEDWLVACIEMPTAAWQRSAKVSIRPARRILRLVQ